MVTAGYVEHDVHVRGLRLRYQEWGPSDAPAIVMLHGFGVSGHMFDEFAARMSDRFRLIALDQRGHGDSEWSEEGDYTREAFVEDVEAFREALGLKSFLLIGHSMGGLNAVSYTARYPERVRALVLVDVGPEAAREGVENIHRFTSGPDELEFDEFVEMALRFNPRRTRENIEERMRHRLRPSESGKWTWKFDKRFRQPESGLRIGGNSTNDETWQLFRSITVPTLLVRGAQSDVLTQDVAERAAREMPRARLVVVPGAGHSVPGDNPDDFTAAVNEFLEDVASGNFQPEAASEPPPLEQMVEIQEATRRRGIGLRGVLLLAAGAAVAIVGVFVVRKGVQSRAEKRRKEEQRRRARARRLASMPLAAAPALSQFDAEQARQRAGDVVAQLSVVGRDGVSRARSAIRDADVQRARETAAELAHTLEDRARHAPETVRTVVQSVDGKELKRRSRKAAKRSRSVADVALRATGLRSKKPSRKRRLARRLPLWPA